MADTVPVQDGLFTTDADGNAHLVGGRCRDCDRCQFPRGTVCPYCGGDGIDEALLSSTGTLWACTAVTAPPPGYQGAVPYGFGVVELPEGVRVITRLAEGDPARLSFGQHMAMQLVPLHTDDEGRTVMTWAFGSR